MSENKNWTGNIKSVYSTLGASNHSKKERALHDFYATDPMAARLLLELEDFNNILEPACGAGHLSKVFEEAGKIVTSTDLIDHGYGEVKDFFTYQYWDGDIVTNPPYKYALQFAEHALNIVDNCRKVIMFLKLQFLEGKRRKDFFIKHPPRYIYVSSSRISCALNGDFDNEGKAGGAVAYCWYVWYKGYKGNPEIKWFN